VAIVEVGMAFWKAIRSHRPTKDPVVQASIELDFRKEWLHMNIFGRIRPPLGGISFPLCTIYTFLMIDVVVASLPARGSPCASPRRLHPNDSFSRDSQGGVLKLSRVGLPRVWELISPSSDLQLE
jgi:hypothetical protein